MPMVSIRFSFKANVEVYAWKDDKGDHWSIQNLEGLQRELERMGWKVRRVEIDAESGSP